MKTKLWTLLLLTTAVFLLSACAPETTLTPTPFLPTTTVTPNIGAASPLTVPLTDLVENPAAYEGARLQLNGRYRQLPLLVCEAVTYRSPATWGLSDGTLLAQMGGFDRELRQLLPEELTMSVTGIWRRWNGPIGCGKTAVTKDIWYLDVREILSPSPLALVTLTPSGEEVAEVPTPTLEIVTVTPDFSDDEEPTPEVTPIVPTPTTFIVGATATVADTSPTATASPEEGTQTPTPEVTSTPETGGEVLIDELGTGSLGFETLGEQEIHIWQLNLFADDVVQISAAAEPGLDLVLSLYDPEGTAVVEAVDTSSAGSIERIANLTVPMDGEYTLHIQSADGTGGHYVFNWFGAEDDPQIFQGILDGSDSVTSNMAGRTDDMWLFYGQANTTVTISLTPEGTSDLSFFMDIYSPTGTVIGDITGIDGDAIEISGLSLPVDGMYAIYLGNFEWESATYELTISQN